MAYLIRRAPWAMVLGALAILAAYLPPQTPPPPDAYRGGWQNYPTPEGRLATRLGDAYHRAARKVYLIRLRDSLMGVIAARRPAPGIVAALAPRRNLEGVARATAEAARPPVAELSPDVRAVFALVTTSPRAWSPGDDFFLPGATDGHTCVATRGIFESAGYLPRPTETLGPCGFFAAFGLPGRQIGRWLESRDYDFAREADWRVRPRPPEPPERHGAMFWIEVALSRVGFVNRPDLVPAYFDSPYGLPLSATGCAAGREDACRHFFFTDSGNRTSPIPNVVERVCYFCFQQRGFMLAALVQEQGPDRFQRFWQSPLAPEEAFDSTFTVPFTQWGPAWIRSTYGTVNVDVVTSAREAGSSALWAVLCAGVCVGLAVTRKVT